MLDVVARLPDPHRLQHAGVAQLPQHQVVAEPQGQLGDAESKETLRQVVGDGRTDDTGLEKENFQERADGKRSRSRVPFVPCRRWSGCT